MNTGGGVGQGLYGPGAFSNPNVNSQNMYNRNMLQNSMFGRTGMRNNQMFNSMQGFGNLGSTNQGPRISIKLGSGPSASQDFQPEGPPHLNSAMTTRLNNILAEKKQSTIPAVKTQGTPVTPSAPTVTVLMQGQTAFLRGSVPTYHDRDLAGRLMLLEPGVDQVKNDLTVGSPNSPTP